MEKSITSALKVSKIGEEFGDNLKKKNLKINK